MSIGSGGAGACTFDLKVPCGIKELIQCPGQGIGHDDLEVCGRSAYVKLDEEGGRKVYQGVLFSSTLAHGYVGQIHSVVGHECYDVGAEGKLRNLVSLLRSLLPRLLPVAGENFKLRERKFKGGDLGKDHTDVASASYMHNVRNRYNNSPEYAAQKDTLKLAVEPLDDFHYHWIKCYEGTTKVREGDEVVIRRPKNVVVTALRVAMVAGKSGVSKHGESDDATKTLNDVADGLKPKGYLMFERAWCAGGFEIHS